MRSTEYRWTVYVITTSGTKVPHWTDTTREKARAVAKGMRPLPNGVRTTIERNS